MYLSMNTYLYELAEVPIVESLDRIRKQGFRYIDYAAYRNGDPTTAVAKGELHWLTTGFAARSDRQVWMSTAETHDFALRLVHGIAPNSSRVYEGVCMAQSFSSGQPIKGFSPHSRHCGIPQAVVTKREDCRAKLV